jgi:hypothetical protein
MRANRRKTRLFALPSTVCPQAGPNGQTLWARQICPLSALDRLENRAVSFACLPAHQANLPRRMEEINGS